MNPQDLMLGDIVQVNGRTGKVTMLDSDSISVEGLSHIPEAVEPVEVSAKMLKKCGFAEGACVSIRRFVLRFGNWKVVVYLDSMPIMSIASDIDTVCDMTDKHFRYVHELQHAMRLHEIDFEFKI